MIASLHDNKGAINIPDFYEDVLDVNKEDRIEMAKAPFDLDHYKNDLSIKAVHGGLH